MTARVTSVVLAGVAGQPVLETARLLAEAAILTGLDASFAECPPALECGGAVWAYVRLGAKVWSPLVSEGGADVLLAFEQLEALRASYLLAPGGFAAVSERLIPTWRLRAALEPPPDVVARLTEVTPRVALVPMGFLERSPGGEACSGQVLLGIASALLPVPEEAYLTVLGASGGDAAARCRAFAHGRAWFAALPECDTAAARPPLDSTGARR